MEEETNALEGFKIENPIERYPTESKDCAVRALCYCLGYSYEQAHNILSGLGRMPNTATASWITDSVMKGAGINPVKPGIKMKLRSFIKRNPTGHFMIRVNRHITTLKDGIIYDRPTALAKSLNRIVRQYWKIENS